MIFWIDMKKSELKKILKPLVKECIKESLLEDGLLSGIIAEVASGLVQSPLMTESKAPATQQFTQQERQAQVDLEEKRALMEQERQERIRALNESASKKFGGVDIFEGTTPTTSETASTPGALSGVSPNDPGVDINGIAALAGGRWNKILKGM
tara:strand:- start:1737 stop:2195 length:459 start_codon:yes stop_codon:yes gene_type:complete